MTRMVERPDNLQQASRSSNFAYEIGQINTKITDYRIRDEVNVSDKKLNHYLYREI